MRGLHRYSSSVCEVSTDCGDNVFFICVFGLVLFTGFFFWWSAFLGTVGCYIVDSAGFDDQSIGENDGFLWVLEISMKYKNVLVASNQI